MAGWVQRLRGALGMGLTWAAGWAPIGALVGSVLHMVLPGGPLGLGSVIALNAVSFAALGFVGGTAFAGVLRLAERNSRFHELSLPRFSGWGAVGGAVLGGVAATAGMWGGGFGLLGVGMIGAATLLGAASAAGTLALARAADDPALLESHIDEDQDDPALTDADRLELLGPS